VKELFIVIKCRFQQSQLLRRKK